MASASSLPKLTYFDLEGRGEIARLCFAKAGIEFIDNRVSFADWPAVKPTTPFGTMPVLEIDGHVLTQSNTINRFLGKRVGLYPTNEFKQAKCDEIMDCVEDVSQLVMSTRGLAPELVKQRREAMAKNELPFYLSRFERELAAAGGKFFTGELTVADLKVAQMLRWLSSGRVDHVPTDLVAGYPLLQNLVKTVAELPFVAEWRAKHGTK